MPPMGEPYFPPPDDYESPSIEGCVAEVPPFGRRCGQPIILVPVVGGWKLVHLVRQHDPHPVAVARPWWDVTTGEWTTVTFVATESAAAAPPPTTEEAPDA